jgi:phospholipase C
MGLQLPLFIPNVHPGDCQVTDEADDQNRQDRGDLRVTQPETTQIRFPQPVGKRSAERAGHDVGKPEGNNFIQTKQVRGDPRSCRNNVINPPASWSGGYQHAGSPGSPDYAWTDLTFLLHRYNVSWAYYVAEGQAPDCPGGEPACKLARQRASTPGFWNPLPFFDTVRQDHQLGNARPLRRFYQAARTGTLPAVTWIVPSERVSEHPTQLVSVGQSYVTHLVNAVMRSPNWDGSAIFLAWDEWGGFYDDVVPPTVDGNGYGLRVPGLVISPYARRGYIDHQTLSFDSYVRFIEDNFLNGERLDPQTDGRPDPRPAVREVMPALGDLRTDFDFSQRPRPPLLLPEHPKTDMLSRPGQPHLPPFAWSSSP